jgi:hypothetical protein
MMLSLSFTQDEWMFIADSLNDRFENLTDLSQILNDYDLQTDAAYAESLAVTIVEAVANV